MSIPESLLLTLAVPPEFCLCTGTMTDYETEDYLARERRNLPSWKCMLIAPEWRHSSHAAARVSST
jgi:hypothetical protein